ncbi:hypothetical protein OJAV_G00205520 [Oryzias javanicus]|uniref:Uncharacterized protein n=1 Tax=Oryzias javanicus TaxID=123683 RepID=A0A437C641_ORYJA|nr:hypothetical protein OJAV_G00205520 [Oryzias javanicus]
MGFIFRLMLLSLLMVGENQAYSLKSSGSPGNEEPYDNQLAPQMTPPSDQTFRVKAPKAPQQGYPTWKQPQEPQNYGYPPLNPSIPMEPPKNDFLHQHNVPSPPQHHGYPPQQHGYPPQQHGVPQQHGYPPQQHGVSQQHGYPPQQHVVHQQHHVPHQHGYPHHQHQMPNVPTSKPTLSTHMDTPGKIRCSSIMFTLPNSKRSQGFHRNLATLMDTPRCLRNTCTRRNILVSQWLYGNPTF